MKFFAAQLPLLCLICLPEQVADVLSLYLAPMTEKMTTWQSRLVMIPYAAISLLLSVYSAAAVFDVVRNLQKGKKPTLGHAVTEVGKQIVPLSLATLLIGVVAALGVAAFIVPGIFVIVVYVFVPHLIMNEPGKPLMVYLNRSWKLAARHKLYVTFLVLTMAISGLLVYSSGSIFPTAEGSYYIAFTIGRALFSTLLGAIIDVWIAVTFLKFQHESEK